MKSLSTQLQLYQQHHQKSITKLSHYLGIPSIILALLLMGALFSMPITAGIVFLMIMYYLYLDLSLGLLAMGCFMVLMWVAFALAVNMSNMQTICASVFCFVLGWAAQFIGHYYEGKKPAFLVSISQILIGPLFLIAELCFCLGFKKDLQAKLQPFTLDIK